MKTKEQMHTEKLHAKWDSKNAVYDALLLAFIKPIKHDYPIPDSYRVNKVVEKVIDALPKNVPKEFKDRMRDIVFVPHDDRSQLARYLSDYDSIFGSEFFYGYGSLYRWRQGQESEAMIRVAKYIPKKEREYIRSMHIYIRKLMNQDFDRFEMDEKLGTY